MISTVLIVNRRPKDDSSCPRSRTKYSDIAASCWKNTMRTGRSAARKLKKTPIGEIAPGPRPGIGPGVRDGALRRARPPQPPGQEGEHDAGQDRSGAVHDEDRG